MNRQSLPRVLLTTSFGCLIVIGCVAKSATPAPPSASVRIPTVHSVVNSVPDSGKATATNGERKQIATDLYVRQLRADVLLVTHEFPWPGNSLVVEMANSDLVIVGSPYTPSAMADVLTWLDAHRGQRRIVAINTGYHVDNLGGNNALIERGIPVYGSDLTARLLSERGEHTRKLVLSMLGTKPGDRYFDAHVSVPYVPPTHLFPIAQGLTLTIGSERVVAYYPGPSQAPDKVVVYFPSKRVLFGGCMILGGDRLGNTAEADLNEWSRAMRKLGQFEVSIVVPGHGDRMDPGLIQHTVDVLAGGKK